LVEPKIRDEVFRRGLSLEMFGAAQADAERRPKYQRFLDEARELGATDLELVVRWSQADGQAIEVTPHPTAGVEDELLTWVMDEAVSRNLRVFLTPVIDLENDGHDHSRAALKPADVEHWWWSYRRFVMHYARIASAHKATLFSVGNQLLSLEADEAHWRALITDVRKVYSGPLTYTAHVDRFDSIAFWDALDTVSVAMGLETSEPAKEADKTLACRALTDRLRGWALSTGKQYFLVGAWCEQVPAVANKRNQDAEQSAASAPTSANFRQLVQQRAFFETWQAEARLSGVFVPQTFARGRVVDEAPSVRAKPAAEVLRHWFTKSRARSMPAAETPPAPK
jgi:hypothetical protein